jgi:V/A-type H+/Na+-transporting ATPase subunit I
VLEGWVRQSDLERLQRALQNTSEAVYLERIAPDPGEVPPVALENRKFFQPAEFLIKLFGLPNQSELDPTPFVLPFFAIFFGIALTDAGYGLALIAIFSYLKRRYRHKRGFQPFANLIILGGISAVIAGGADGGIFRARPSPSILDVKIAGALRCEHPCGVDRVFALLVRLGISSSASGESVGVL